MQKSERTLFNEMYNFIMVGISAGTAGEDYEGDDAASLLPSQQGQVGIARE